MIVSFYSFKGGVGRSLALAHTAWRLAARSPEQQILAIDLDLEAPGLDSYFAFPGLDECKGLAGLIRVYQQQPEVERREWLRRMLSDESHGYVVRPRGENQRTNLWYLPSGLGRGRSVSYRRVTAWLRKEIEMQDRSQGWPAAATRGFLGDFRGVLGEGFSYALIDSRTGLADEAFASTVLLADALVVCFRLSDIHLQGIRSAVANFAKRKGLPVDHPALPLIPVVTPLPTRGGQDIHHWLKDKVLPLFLRWRPPEDDLDTWERSPLLALDAPIVRLYEEPFLEIGQPMLVDSMGEFLPGFDDRVPLVAGYNSLVDSIRLLGYRHDLKAAAELEKEYLPERPQLALRYWRIQADALLEASFVLSENYASPSIRAEAVLVAVEVLESWELRLTPNDDASHDTLALAWNAVAHLAAAYDNVAAEKLGERAVREARSEMVKGMMRLDLATQLRLRILKDAVGQISNPRLSKETDDPKGRLIELLTLAEQELRISQRWVSLLSCLQVQIEICQDIGRFQSAVDALGKAMELFATNKLDDVAALSRARVAALCLVLGFVATAVHVGAPHELWSPIGIGYLLQMGWRHRAAGIATRSAGINPDLLILAHVDADNAFAAPPSIEGLSTKTSLYLTILHQIVTGVLAPVALDLENALEEYPQLLPIYDIWARLFDRPSELSDAEVLAAIHRYNLDTALIGIRAWLTDEPGQATRMLRRQLSQSGSMDGRARALVFYGLHAALLGNAQIARRCGKLLTEINECTPAVAVVVRNGDSFLITLQVLQHLKKQGRLGSTRHTLVSELLKVIGTPRDLPEPETLAWSWEDGLPLDDMRHAAELLERLPDEIDEILALPLEPAQVIEQASN